MKIDASTYGHTPDNPILVTGVEESFEFLNGLVTDKGYYILYHRKRSLSVGKSKPIDHYEILKGDGTYDDLYISIYAEEDKFIPPEGYKFDYHYDFVHFFDPAYYYHQVFPEEKHITEAALEIINSWPLLHRYLGKTHGVNYRVKNFPFELLEELIKNKKVKMPTDYKTFIETIKPREV